MSIFTIPIELGGLAGQRFETVEATVDTGATLTAAPREVLERLGVRPSRRQRFELANGEITEREVGDAWIRFQGVEGATPVVFNEPGEPALLGAVTLESFFLGVDPINERLIPVVGLRISRFPI